MSKEARPSEYRRSNPNFAFTDNKELRGGIQHFSNFSERNTWPQDKRAKLLAVVYGVDENDIERGSWVYEGSNFTDEEWVKEANWNLFGGSGIVDNTTTENSISALSLEIINILDTYIVVKVIGGFGGVGTHRYNFSIQEIGGSIMGFQSSGSEQITDGSSDNWLFSFNNLSENTLYKLKCHVEDSQGFFEDYETTTNIGTLLKVANITIDNDGDKAEISLNTIINTTSEKFLYHTKNNGELSIPVTYDSNGDTTVYYENNFLGDVIEIFATQGTLFKKASSQSDIIIDLNNNLGQTIEELTFLKLATNQFLLNDTTPFSQINAGNLFPNLYNFEITEGNILLLGDLAAKNHQLEELQGRLSAWFCLEWGVFPNLKSLHSKNVRKSYYQSLAFEKNLTLSADDDYTVDFSGLTSLVNFNYQGNTSDRYKIGLLPNHDKLERIVLDRLSISGATNLDLSNCSNLKVITMSNINTSESVPFVFGSSLLELHLSSTYSVYKNYDVDNIPPTFRCFNHNYSTIGSNRLSNIPSNSSFIQSLMHRIAWKGDVDHSNIDATAYTYENRGSNDSIYDSHKLFRFNEVFFENVSIGGTLDYRQRTHTAYGVTKTFQETYDEIISEGWTVELITNSTIY